MHPGDFVSTIPRTEVCCCVQLRMDMLLKNVTVRVIVMAAMGMESATKMGIFIFAVAPGHVIVNMYSKKNDEHLVTFTSEKTRLQLDFCVLRRKDLKTFTVDDFSL